MFGLWDVVSHIDVLKLFLMSLLLSFLNEVKKLSLELLLLQLVASSSLDGLAFLEGLEVKSDLPLLEEFLIFFFLVPGWDHQLLSPPWSVGLAVDVLGVLAVGVLDNILIEDGL